MFGFCKIVDYNSGIDKFCVTFYLVFAIPHHANEEMKVAKPDE